MSLGEQHGTTEKKNRLKYIKKGIKESADTLKSFKGVWLYQRMSMLKYETTRMTRDGLLRSV